MWPWLWRQQTNLFTWPSGSRWCITKPNLVTKGSAAQKYLLDKHSLKAWTSDVTLTLNTAIQSFHKTLQLMMMYIHTKFGMMHTHNMFGCKRISSSDDIVEPIIFDYMSPVTLILKLAHQSFHVTLQPTIIHHNTKFGYKRFCCAESIIEIFIKNLNLWCDLDFEHSNLIFP